MTNTTKKLSGFVTLSTEDGDLGVFIAQAGVMRARQEAAKLKTVVYARHPTTDEILWTE